jgi:hypothetical protein
MSWIQLAQDSLMIDNYEDGNEFLESVKSLNFVGCMNDCELMTKDAVSWS